MDGQTDTKADTHREPTDKQAGKQRQTARPTEKQASRQANRQTDRLTSKQVNGPIDRNTHSFLWWTLYTSSGACTRTGVCWHRPARRSLSEALHPGETNGRDLGRERCLCSPGCCSGISGTHACAVRDAVLGSPGFPAPMPVQSGMLLRDLQDPCLCNPGCFSEISGTHACAVRDGVPGSPASPGPMPVQSGTSYLVWLIQY